MSVINGKHPKTEGYYFIEGCSPEDIQEIPQAPEWLLAPLIEKKDTPAKKQPDTTDETQKAREYLAQIDPVKCMQYEPWLKVLMALHSVSDDLLPDAIEWSSKMANFDGEECLRKWESFNRSGAISIGTLRHYTKIYGYGDPGSQGEIQDPKSDMSTMDLMSLVDQKHQKLKELSRAIKDIIITKGMNEYTHALIKEAMGELGISLSQKDLGVLIQKALMELTPPAEPVRGGEIMEQDEVPWLIKDIFLLDGINLLVALPKIGKSSLVIAALSAYLNGETHFLGQALHDEQRPVLIIGTDQPSSDWARMLKRGGLVDDDNRLHPSIIALYTSNSPIYLDEQGFNRIEQHCADNPDLIIVLDSYARLTSTLGVEEKSEEYAYPLYKLSDCASRYSATVIAIHHSNKGEHGGSGVRSSRGTTAVPAACSQVVNMVRLENNSFNSNDTYNKPSFCELHTDGRGGPQMMFKLKSTSTGWGLATKAELDHSNSEAEGELSSNHEEAYSYVIQCWDESKAGVSTKALAQYLGDISPAGNKRATRILNRLHTDKHLGKTMISRGYGQGRPINLYVPKGLDKEQLSDIKDIVDIKDT